MSSEPVDGDRDPAEFFIVRGGVSAGSRRLHVDASCRYIENRETRCVTRAQYPTNPTCEVCSEDGENDG